MLSENIRPTAQVLTMFEKADAEYAELSQKKQILHMDKDKIEKVHSAKLPPKNDNCAHSLSLQGFS